MRETGQLRNNGLVSGTDFITSHTIFLLFHWSPMWHSKDFGSQESFQWKHSRHKGAKDWTGGYVCCTGTRHWVSISLQGFGVSVCLEFKSAALLEKYHSQNQHRDQNSTSTSWKTLDVTLTCTDGTYGLFIIQSSPPVKSWEITAGRNARSFLSESQDCHHEHSVQECFSKKFPQRIALCIKISHPSSLLK